MRNHTLINLNTAAVLGLGLMMVAAILFVLLRTWSGAVEDLKNDYKCYGKEVNASGTYCVQ